MLARPMAHEPVGIVGLFRIRPMRSAAAMIVCIWSAGSGIGHAAGRPGAVLDVRFGRLELARAFEAAGDSSPSVHGLLPLDTHNTAPSRSRLRFSKAILPAAER